MRVAVAGGGLAGLTAALRAVDLGASVTLLEKGDRPGGSFLLSSGYIWSYRDMPTYRREAPGGDIALQELILNRLGFGLEWLERAGGVLLSRETGNLLTFGARFDPGQTVAALVERILASGARILTTLVHAMQRRPDTQFGLATMCIGVGQGISMVVEKPA